MTTPGNPAAPSPYPTVQILQAAMAHRDSIRRSFESQRATLAEAIAAQRQQVTQAVANAQQGDAPDSVVAGVPIGATPLEKLVVALTLFTVPGAAATQNAAAQRAMAARQFLDALQVLIAAEVARQLAGELPGTADGVAAAINP